MKKIVLNRYVAIVISVLASIEIVDPFIRKNIYNDSMKMIVTFVGTIAAGVLIFWLLSKIFIIKPEKKE